MLARKVSEIRKNVLHLWLRFVPIGALLVSVRDLEDAPFVERFA